MSTPTRLMLRCPQQHGKRQELNQFYKTTTENNDDYNSKHETMLEITIIADPTKFHFCEFENMANLEHRV